MSLARSTSTSLATAAGLSIQTSVHGSFDLLKGGDQMNKRTRRIRRLTRAFRH